LEVREGLQAELAGAGLEDNLHIYATTMMMMMGMLNAGRKGVCTNSRESIFSASAFYLKFL